MKYLGWSSDGYDDIFLTKTGLVRQGNFFGGFARENSSPGIIKCALLCATEST
jgi:hypothetical protein